MHSAGNLPTCATLKRKCHFGEMAINGDTRNTKNIQPWNHHMCYHYHYHCSYSFRFVMFQTSSSWKHSHQANVLRLSKISNRWKRYPFANMKLIGPIGFSYKKICICALVHNLPNSSVIFEFISCMQNFCLSWKPYCRKLHTTNWYFCRLISCYPICCRVLLSFLEKLRSLMVENMRWPEITAAINGIDTRKCL